MQPDLLSQATLWRTCRVLANRLRLEMFRWVLNQPDQTVSSVALEHSQSIALASLYLRALEARGLLAARRAGRQVSYRPAPATGQGPAAGLVAALRSTFKGEADPIEKVFHLATAFTHPRRVEIFRLIHSRPRPLEQLRAASHISERSLLRHLKKLEARGFVIEEAGEYSASERRDVLGRELARRASE